MTLQQVFFQCTGENILTLDSDIKVARSQAKIDDKNCANNFLNIKGLTSTFYCILSRANKKHNELVRYDLRPMRCDT